MTLDQWLNIGTIIGTISAIIIALYKAKPERKKLEADTDQSQMGAVKTAAEANTEYATQVKDLLVEVRSLRTENKDLIKRVGDLERSNGMLIGDVSLLKCENEELETRVIKAEEMSRSYARAIIQLWKQLTVNNIVPCVSIKDLGIEVPTL